MRKIFTLLTVLVASVCGLMPAKADKATLDEGYYYIINTYEKFASMKAWFYGQVDARQADQYAFLCWDDFSANDPRFIFEVKKGTAENGYILKSMASEFFLSGLSSDSLVAANPDAGTNYYFEEVGSTDDGKPTTSGMIRWCGHAANGRPTTAFTPTATSMAPATKATWAATAGGPSKTTVPCSAQE